MQRSCVLAILLIAQGSFAQGLLFIDIVGPTEISEQSETQYECVAHFEGGGSQEITVLADWSVEPANLATIDTGELIVGDILADVWLQVSASWEFLGEVEHASIEVLVTNTTTNEIAEFFGQEISEFANFGWSIAADGSIVIVGSPTDGPRGSAFLFDASDPLNTAELAKLKPPVGDEVDGFGVSVSVHATTALVGAETFGGEGAAYLYDIENPESPVLVAKLIPKDGREFSHFGGAVALSDTAALVGDRSAGEGGKVYIFDRVTGEQIAELSAGDGAGFGNAIAANGFTAIVGAFISDEFGTATGSAFVYDISDPAMPIEKFKLLADDAESWNYFGFSVAIDGESAVVGANLDSDNGLSSGSAYVFDVTTGEQLFKIKPDDGAGLDFFGASVAIRDGLVLVGMPEDDGQAGEDYGAAYYFNALTGEQIAKLQASDADVFDGLGTAVVFNDAGAFVGAAAGDGNVANTGSVYVFSSEVACPPDFNGDGMLNILDFVTFQLAWMAGLGAADCDGDGAHTIIDFVCYQVLFVKGCL